MSSGKASFGSPIDHEHYLKIRKAHIQLHQAVTYEVHGPNAIDFQKRGSATRGCPITELLPPTAGYTLLEDAYNEDIGFFFQSGVPEIQLIMEGPSKERKGWGYHLSLLPLVANTTPIIHKASLANSIALQYYTLFMDADSVSGAHPESRPQNMNLVSLKNVFANVYQAEFVPSNTPRLPVAPAPAKQSKRGGF